MNDSAEVHMYGSRRVICQHSLRDEGPYLRVLSDVVFRSEILCLQFL